MPCWLIFSQIITMTRVHNFVSDIARGNKMFFEIQKLVNDCNRVSAISDSQIYRIITKVRVGEDPSDTRATEFAVPNAPVKCGSTIEETQDMPPLNQLEHTSISKEEEFEHHNSEDCISLSMALTFERES
ncbi:unnamed protein product [Lepeophtheirus salmonis]|uniref:(salmon louse) hypothetical protein n=1 Tax=Lepeophtheirus salmonis TaxID=72036 RepID=A0A7R8CPS8_LEPSM|nr:unnamed protein product [Lepeophtheirus salmonis]CAF2853805.1 unnamed protein product [Lepeophtheirus salmonis]